MSSLDDDVFKAVDLLTLSDAVLGDYGQLKSAMKNPFSPTTSSFELHFNLWCRRQQDGEDFDNFAEELSWLAIKAYPELAAKTRLEVIHDRFIKGLRDEYSGTSLIHTAIIQLLGLSGIDLENILINAHATCMTKLTMASSSTKCNSKKRKWVVRTLDDKCAILDRLKSETQEKLAEYGVGHLTIGDIKKSKDKLRAFTLTMEGLAMNTKGRKVMCLADNEKLDKAVYLWFIQKRSQDMPVSGPVLCEKATQLHAQLHEGDPDNLESSFQASRGWGGFGVFVSAMELGNSLQGEKVSSDVSAVEPFKKELQELLKHEHLTLDQLFNCDEMGLCYRMLPDKTLAARSEKDASAMKKQKERVTY